MDSKKDVFSPLVKASFWILSVLGFVVFSRRISPSTKPQKNPKYSNPPRTICQEQYASGPIDMTLPTMTPALPATCRESCECCHHKVPWWKIVLDWLTFFAVLGAFIATAVYARFTYCIMEATQSQAKVSQTQMYLSQRPWIGLNAEVQAITTSPIVFDQNGDPFINYEIRVKNFGQFGAQGVFEFARSFITEDIDKVQKGPRGSCTAYEPSIGTVLFPGKITEVMQQPSMYYPKDWIKTNAQGTTQGWLVGCITYGDQFGFVYHSMFTYRFVDPKTHSAVLFRPGKNVVIPGQFELYSSSMDAPDYSKPTPKN